MELSQLQQFQAIAACATMTQAAEKLHISQPALSAALRKLEEELGLRLFERTRNSIALNSAGELALLHTNEILAQAERMKAALRQYAQRNAALSVAFCDPGPLWYCVPRFSMSYPALKIKPALFEETEEVAKLLRNQTYDIVVSTKALAQPDIVSMLFIKEQLLLSVPAAHPLAAQAQLSLREAKLPAIVLFQVDGSFFKKQRKFWDALASTVRVTVCGNYFLFNQMVRGTEACTISTKLVQHYRDDGPGRVLIPLTDPELSIAYHIAYLRKNQPRLRAFLAWATQCRQDLAD